MITWVKLSCRIHCIQYLKLYLLKTCPSNKICILEFSSIFFFTRAQQFPKEYPELADCTTNVPDSSNRLTSPAPSSEAASPVTRVLKTSVDTSTQTDEVSTSAVSCQVRDSNGIFGKGKVNQKSNF